MNFMKSLKKQKKLYQKSVKITYLITFNIIIRYSEWKNF